MGYPAMYLDVPGPDGFVLTQAFQSAGLGLAAAIGRGSGCAGVTVRAPGDLAAVAGRVRGPRDRPLVVDAKVTRASPAGGWPRPSAATGQRPWDQAG